MIKSFLMRQMLKKQLRGVPEPEQEKLLGALEKNPALFETIAKETQEKMKAGKDQQTAALEVAQKYQKELVEAFK